MPRELRFRIESHGTAATLYVSGPLTAADARRALRVGGSLPVPVTELRVDLRAAILDDPGPIAALAMLLARWRRLGPLRRTRLDLPPAHRRPAATPPSAASRTARRRLAPGR